jgi:hypothetical protein
MGLSDGVPMVVFGWVDVISYLYCCHLGFVFPLLAVANVVLRRDPNAFRRVVYTIAALSVVFRAAVYLWAYTWPAR